MREKLIKNEVLICRDKKTWKNVGPHLKTLSTSPTGGLRIRGWWLAILGFLLASLIVINTVITGQFRVTHIINTTQDNYFDTESQLVSIENKKSGFLVRNKGCRIAALDPLNSLSKRFMKTELPIVCEYGTQLPLIESNETHLFINSNAFNQYYNTTEIPNCCWREFKRKENNDNAIKYDNSCHPFQFFARINSAEFVKVECQRESASIYRDYHFFVPRKPEVEERCKNNAAGQNEKQKRKKFPSQQRPSVLILGLDSVSRLNFHRMMPKTVKTLEKLNAIEMLGYNKVGDNTYPNLVPVLTGLSDTELQHACWNETTKPYDSCPFLWKSYSASGYRTVFAEDACSITTFNYLKPGFDSPPTDYYLRPYCIAAETDIGNTHKLNANLCIGTRTTYENLLNYTKKIVRTFSKEAYFAFFWEASLTHDFFNYPQIGDDAYSTAIRNLHQKNHLTNTILIVMSDHGMRWGEFRQTYQGRIEGSLPFVFLVFPDWWRMRYPAAFANLRRNAGSLTTPFDLHETLVDILMSDDIREAAIRERTRTMEEDVLPRGISWFLPIPEYRTCDLAGIPGHWCMCHKSTNVSMDDDAVRNVTSFLIDEINLMLRKYPQCGELKIKSVIDAKVWNQADSKEYAGTPWIDYTVTIETVPGNAIFEASVRRSDGASRLVGSISRLNSYGKQSACVNDFNMRLYCYCQSS